MNSKFILFGLIALLFVSCKDEKNNTESGTAFPNSFQAVWQSLPFDDGDEIGFYFTDTSIFLWDYYGDSFDQGENCYDLESAWNLISFEGNVFTVVSPLDGSSYDLTMLVSGNVLTISAIEDGEEFTLNFQKTTRTVESLVPLCTVNQKTTAPKTYTHPWLLK